VKETKQNKSHGRPDTQKNLQILAGL
jgi:hypothetical protein